jgi:hypothetical protein
MWRHNIYCSLCWTRSPVVQHTHGNTSNGSFTYYRSFDGTTETVNSIVKCTRHGRSPAHLQRHTIDLRELTYFRIRSATDGTSTSGQHLQLAAQVHSDVQKSSQSIKLTTPVGSHLFDVHVAESPRKIVCWQAIGSFATAPRRKMHAEDAAAVRGRLSRPRQVRFVVGS